MNCDQVRELLPDVAAGMNAQGGDVEAHIASCAGCAAKLQGLRRTMMLLDEWEAPAPSPYFDTRLGARLREEMARPARARWQWLARPAWAGALAALLVVGAGVANKWDVLFPGAEEPIAIRIPVPSVPATPGSAVGDLQSLEKNDDLYADFDMLDSLQVQDRVTANP